MEGRMITSVEDLNKQVKRRKTNTVSVGDSEKNEKEMVLKRPEFQNSFFAIMMLPPKPIWSVESFLLPPLCEKDKPLNTLVLDLDETLVHCSTEKEDVPHCDHSFQVHFRGKVHKVYVGKRPHLDNFLEQVSQWYEIVVFTASQREYADKLLDILDPNKKLFSHRLFREACRVVDGNFVKDLSVLGRDVKNTIIIDNSPLSFGYHLNNGIPINSWFSNQNDSELLNLLPFLQSMSTMADVRPVLKGRYGLSTHIQTLMKIP